MLLACLLIAGSVLPVSASGSTDFREDTALIHKSGSVFPVEMVCVDSQQEVHVVKRGNGFLIGSEEDASYVITSKETICVEAELREQVMQEYGLEPEAETETNTDTETMFLPRLVIKNDVAMAAEIVASSEEIGFAVLKLPQPVHGREALCFSPNSQQVEAMDSVYSLRDGEGMAEGQVFKRFEESEISLLWHTAFQSGQGSGSPLVDEEGNVIGINTRLLENSYMQAVDIEEVIAILDVFGVPYTMAQAADEASVSEQPEVTKIPADTAAAQQGDMMEQGAEPEPDVGMPLSSENKEAGNLSPVLWGGIGVLAVMLIGIIIPVCRIAAGDKKKDAKPSEPQNRAETPVPLPVSGNRASVFSDETTMLGGNSPAGYDSMEDAPPEYPPLEHPSPENSAWDEEATTILSGRMGMEEYKGFLIRERNGERISLLRSLFVIGSDGLRVDYCIRDNKSISRVHAQIRQLNGAYTLENLHATNGTCLNGVKLQDSEAKPLRPGDCIRLANEEFLFYI